MNATFFRALLVVSEGCIPLQLDHYMYILVSPNIGLPQEKCKLIM